MSAETELKPCQFCGNVERWEDDGYRHKGDEACAIGELMRARDQQRAEIERLLDELKNHRQFYADSHAAADRWDDERVSLKAEIERLTNERDALKMQAKIWAGEDAGHKATLHEIYKAVTRSTGEPGDWNGSRPVVEELARMRLDVADLTGVIETQKRDGDALEAEIERLREEQDALKELLERAAPILDDCLNDAPQTPYDDIETLLTDIAALKERK